jgi:hypothetical protein
MSQHKLRYKAVEMNGVTLHVVEQRHGPAILLCHGFPDGWRGCSTTASRALRTIALLLFSAKDG